jgi:hypothetical protein
MDQFHHCMEFTDVDIDFAIKELKNSKSIGQDFIG